MRISFDEFKDIVKREALSKEIVLVGIGTDKLINDAFGPIVAEMASHSLKNIISLNGVNDIYNALNIRDKYDDNANIFNSDRYFVIAVDACVVINKDTDDIFFKDECIKPGLAFNRNLPCIGDVSIQYSIKSCDFDTPNEFDMGIMYNIADFPRLLKACSTTINLLKELDKELI